MPNHESAYDESVDSSRIHSIRVKHCEEIRQPQAPTCEQYTAYPGRDCTRQNPDPDKCVSLPAWHGMSFVSHPRSASGGYPDGDWNNPSIGELFEAPLDTECNTITSVLPVMGDKHSYSEANKAISVTRQQRQIFAKPGSTFVLCAYPPGEEPVDAQECKSLFPSNEYRDSLWIKMGPGVSLNDLDNKMYSFEYVTKRKS